jgi:putative RecB family exonuclease
LHGFIDRLDRVEQEGKERWFITDYKTGKVPSDRFLADNFFAMKVYAALYRSIHKIKVEQLRLVYVKERGRTSVKTMNVTDAMLRETEREMSRIWAEIRDFAARDYWPTKVGKLCPWCDFQDICPAFANPELEQMLPEVVDESSYVASGA